MTLIVTLMGSVTWLENTLYLNHDLMEHGAFP